jgi:hypothetical protein
VGLRPVDEVVNDRGRFATLRPSALDARMVGAHPSGMQAMGSGLHPSGAHGHDLRGHPVWGVVMAVVVLASLWVLGLLIYSVLLPLTG